MCDRGLFFFFWMRSGWIVGLPVAVGIILGLASPVQQLQKKGPTLPHEFGTSNQKISITGSQQLRYYHVIHPLMPRVEITHTAGACQFTHNELVWIILNVTAHKSNVLYNVRRFPRSYLHNLTAWICMLVTLGHMRFVMVHWMQRMSLRLL